MYIFKELQIKLFVVKNTVDELPQIYVMAHLNSRKILGTLNEQELENQSEFRI